MLKSNNGCEIDIRTKTKEILLRAFMESSQKSQWEKLFWLWESFENLMFWSSFEWMRCYFLDYNGNWLNFLERGKVKYLAKFSRTYTLRCLQVSPKKNIKLSSPQEITLELRPKVRTFSKIAGTWDIEQTTKVAVSTWKKNDNWHWNETNVNVNTWLLSAQKTFVFDWA